MEEKNNTGIVSENEYKTTDKQPDFKGSGNWKGQKFDLSLWYNKTKNGKEYFSIAFQEPYKKEESEGEKPSWKDRQKIEDNGVIEPLGKDEGIEDLPF